MTWKSLAFIAAFNPGNSWYCIWLRCPELDTRWPHISFAYQVDVWTLANHVYLRRELEAVVEPWIGHHWTVLSPYSTGWRVHPNSPIVRLFHDLRYVVARTNWVEYWDCEPHISWR